MRRILPMILALTLLVGCAGGGQFASQPTQSARPVQPKEDGVVDLISSDCKAESGDAYANFALNLLRAGRTEGENVLMSPLSVMLALGMTSAGAAGNTAQEFARLFGMEQDALTAHCRTLLEDYSDLGGSSEANLANSLWCDPDMELDDRFLTTCRDDFDAQVYHADLQSADTVQAVNDWVKDATKGMIPRVVDHFDEQAVLALINAVYFKNQFQRPFKPSASEWTMEFYNADGTVAQPLGMSNGERKEIYLTHENGQGVVMPYDDGKLGLLLMLPDEGMSLTDYLASWDGGTIAGLLENQTDRQVHLTVPKFKAEWDGELKDTLTALGLADAFDPASADFSAMGRSEKGPFFIGSVIHKTAFEVNEKGTEAAAVTAVMVEFTGLPQTPDDLVVLRFERPFVYGIVDLETGAPLFLGTMEHMD